MSIVSVLNQDSLKADKSVQVSYALDGSVPATSDNYVALCVTSSAEGEYITYSYASDSPNAQVSVPIEGYESVMEGQQLEVRFYDEQGKTRASCPFTLSGETVESFEYSFLQSYVYEDNIIATFQLADAEPHRPSSSDYIGVCDQGAPPGSYFCYAYCVGARSGSVPIGAGGWESSLEGKKLVLRYYSTEDTTVLESEPFAFTSGSTSSMVTKAPSQKPVSKEPESVVTPSSAVPTSPQVASSPSPSPAPSVVQASPPVVSKPPQAASPAPVAASGPVASPPVAVVASGTKKSAGQVWKSKGTEPVATLPCRRRYVMVDGQESARVARYADAQPGDIPVVEMGDDRKLRELKAQYRPASPKTSPVPASSKPKKKGAFLKKLATGVATNVVTALSQPDVIGPQIAQLEESIQQRDAAMTATPKPRDMDSYLSTSPRPCRETAMLRVGMILAKESYTPGSPKPTRSLYEIRDIDGPELLLHPLRLKPSDQSSDMWVMYDAPVLRALEGEFLVMGLLKPFSNYSTFFYRQYLHHVDRAPVPRSFFASRPVRPRDKLCGHDLYASLYVQGYWSMANLPLVDPLQDMRRYEPSLSSAKPDYSRLPRPNHGPRQQWYNNTVIRLNQEHVTPQELLQRAQSGQIQWDKDSIFAGMSGLERKGRTFSPAAHSPYASLRNPTQVTTATPLPWFFLWEDPPAVFSGHFTSMVFEWHSATLVSLEELQAKLDAEEAQYGLVMPVQYGFYDNNGTPSYQDKCFLEPAWLPSLASCPHLPTSRGREDMEFWVRTSPRSVTRVTLKALEDACVLGMSGKDSSFELPGLQGSFRSHIWPCHIPMPAKGWESDLVPYVFQAFPSILDVVKS